MIQFNACVMRQWPATEMVAPIEIHSSFVGKSFMLAETFCLVLCFILWNTD
jgi:hypothetical protein